MQKHDLNPIKQNFAEVQELRTDLFVVLEQMQGFIVTLHKVYGDLVKTHDVKSYTLGLDSLHFQHKVLEMDYESLKKSVMAVENRMYCEYYKLYKMVQAYVATDLKDGMCHLTDKIKKPFPVYKDLEPFKAYNFALTIELQETIGQIVDEMSAFYRFREKEIDADASHADKGINVDNMVTAERFSNQLISERIHLFMRYLNVFNKQHVQYFHNLLAKSKIILQLMNHDIHITTDLFETNNSIFTTASSSSASSVNEMSASSVNEMSAATRKMSALSLTHDILFNHGARSSGALPNIQFQFKPLSSAEPESPVSFNGLSPFGPT